MRSSKWIDRLCKTVFICSAYAVEAAVEMQGAPGQKSRGDDEHDRVHLKQRDAQERAGKVHQAEKAEKTDQDHGPVIQAERAGSAHEASGPAPSHR